MARNYREAIKKAPGGAFLLLRCCLAMLFVVVGAGLVARVTTNRRAAQRAERAAARHRGANRAASGRAADRTDGLALAHARAGREAEHPGKCTKRYQRLQHMHLLVKTMGIAPAAQVQPRSRKITNRTGIGTPSAQSRM